MLHVGKCCSSSHVPCSSPAMCPAAAAVVCPAALALPCALQQQPCALQQHCSSHRCCVAVFCSSCSPISTPQDWGSLVTPCTGGGGRAPDLVLRHWANAPQQRIHLKPPQAVGFSESHLMYSGVLGPSHPWHRGCPQCSQCSSQRAACCEALHRGAARQRAVQWRG